MDRKDDQDDSRNNLLEAESLGMEGMAPFVNNPLRFVNLAGSQGRAKRRFCPLIPAECSRMIQAL